MSLTQEELMQLQVTDMEAYLKAVKTGVIPECTVKQKKQQKFPTEFGEAKASNIAAVYEKGKKKNKKKKKKDYFFDESSALDQFSTYYEDNTGLSDNEIEFYKAIRLRIDRLESGSLPDNEYETLLKLCRAVADLHYLPSLVNDHYASSYDDDDDEDASGDEEMDSYLAGTPFRFERNSSSQTINPFDDDEEEDTDLYYDDGTEHSEIGSKKDIDTSIDDEESDDYDDTTDSIFPTFYVRYDTEAERISINNRMISMNLLWGMTPVINHVPVSVVTNIFERSKEIEDFIYKYYLSYMCTHMYPNVVLPTDKFEQLTHGVVAYSKKAWVFINREDYVLCYYVAEEQSAMIIEALYAFVATYDGTEKDRLDNMADLVMLLICDLQRDAMTIGPNEFHAIVNDDSRTIMSMTSTDNINRFMRAFMNDNRTIVGNANVSVKPEDYEEVQCKMFLFTSEMRGEDGDSYTSIDTELSKMTASEIIKSRIVTETDEEEGEGSSNNDEPVVESEPFPVSSDSTELTGNPMMDALRRASVHVSNVDDNLKQEIPVHL